jgi:hypothetical protein
VQLGCFEAGSGVVPLGWIRYPIASGDEATVTG